MKYEPKLEKEFLCPVEYALDVFGGKWKIRIINLLNGYNVMRYNEIKKELGGITHPVLAAMLKELNKDKIIERRQYKEIPPRVEYSLTIKGRTAIPIFQELCLWSKQNSDLDFMKLPPCTTCDIHDE